MKGMNKKTGRNVVAGLLVVFLFGMISSPSLSAEKAELYLWRTDPFSSGLCGRCGDFVQFNENENRADFSEFSLYTHAGDYSVVLHGPAGTTVTLFGAKGYNRGKGYLTIVKKDDSVVQISDLEAFTPETWVMVPAQPGWSGAFSVYYKAARVFSNRIASVQWGDIE